MPHKQQTPIQKGHKPGASSAKTYAAKTCDAKNYDAKIYDAKIYDACVVGNGPTGLIAALCLAQQNLVTALISDTPIGDLAQQADQRTAGLFSGSITLLQNLGVWQELEQQCAQIVAIRLCDGHAGMLRSPETVFHAADINLEQLGFNVPHRPLVEHLVKAIERTKSIETIEGTADTVSSRNDLATLALTNKTSVQTRLVVAADGSNSACRASVGIPTSTWNYPQTAIITCFSHTRPHFNISTEFQLPDGPLTTVPLPGKNTSLVWMVSNTEAERLLAMASVEFSTALEGNLNGLLGRIIDIGSRAAFPLSGLQANVFAQDRVALIGEAAHRIPPIGAQGLNMGIADAAQIAELAGAARKSGNDPGGGDVLQRYHRLRHADVSRRCRSIDLLNKSYSVSWLPGHLLRGAGLHAISALSPAKRQLMQLGLNPQPLPNLMRATPG